MVKIFLTGLFVFIMLVTTACGGNENGVSSNNTETREGSEITVVATNWDFDQETYTVPAGEVTVNLVNEEGFHGIKIDDTSISIEGEGSYTASLEPGEYRIWCSIPCGEGHDVMEATLIVE
ncbi:cytochrome c oxidase subunit II [Evansella cellulosilytica]|uniref:Cytochrome c oxidase subunit II n=1 Tax=Evansella cellulosilytica (strain ATCC 21833 / DSM 2522 / FERM P-1141 / JCM 9156 / N-4) TaxID=649639 RepID=E6TR62_EVAC2|nr:cytochrome c oxidase subunit II [Evansella cellulosilytica]ADU30574.1 cytochrome c oxidase subunit II [Evansella cellulosilytica DSM 2522]